MALLILSCQKDVPINSNPAATESGEVIDREDASGEGPTVLGQKRSNPYAVENVRLAYNSLYSPALVTLNANFLYVRFLPQSPEDVGKLLRTGLEFTDFPLDYDITYMGEYYHDASVSDPNYTWEYAVVPYNFTFPAVQYEVLEQLALVPEESQLSEKAFQLTGNTFDVPDVYEAKPGLVNGRFDFAPDHGNPPNNPESPGGSCNCSLPDNVRKPSGCVTVFDNMLNQWDGVREVKVLVAKTRIFGWAFHRTAITTGRGCWWIQHNYHGSIHVWVKFESPTSNIKVMEGTADIWGYTWPYQPYIGKYGGPNFNNIGIAFDWTNSINSKPFRNWAAATANNSVFEFQSYAATKGLPSPPGNLKVLITPWGNGNSGATPMLDKSFTNSLNFGGGATVILAGVFGIFSPYAAAAALALGVWITVAAPDIVRNLNNNTEVNADDIREIFYHELSHAQHFTQAGGGYWGDNINYIIDNMGYGNGNAAGAGRCSVIESWGWHIGRIEAHDRYGISNSNTGSPASNTWRRRLEGEYAWTVSSTGLAHIPWGWEWDLQDNNATNPSNELENALVGSSGDAVTGVTEAQIFSTMTSSMLSIPQMKPAMVPFLPPTVTTLQYNTLCKAYGF